MKHRSDFNTHLAFLLLAAAAVPGCGGEEGSSADVATLAQGLTLASPATQVSQRYFPATAPWYTDVSTAAVAADSSAITAWMVGASAPNGFGTGKLKVDFSIVTVDVPAGTAKRTPTKVTDYFYTPDCDTAPIPVPSGGAVEQTYGVAPVFTSPFSGYNCANFSSGADCHLLFVARGESRLYEVYHGTIDSANTFRTGCLAIWNTSTTSVNGRGQQCSSADAAGFPIAPLLFTPEEIQAGQINHAIRFILPNRMIRARKYVAPGTHGTNTTGPATAPPYAARLRLRASYPLTSLSPAARVVARALQKYGMLLADGGNIALTAQSDVLSSVKWSAVGFTADALAALKATDFEVISYGTPTDVTYNCTRTPITN
ncbi:MAG TPA: hypothetical protein PLW65_11225 [Pseudomonadota bacterium]|nr:hypothetical protein [Pseudomonadota bacterium]